MALARAASGPWLLLVLALCIGLMAPVAHGLFRCMQQPKPAAIGLARAFNGPLYALSLLVLLLRVSFFCSCGVRSPLVQQDASLPRLVAFFWLLEMPSACLIALHGYLVLFYAGIVHWRRWNTALSSCSWADVLYALVCACFLLLTTCFACLCGYLKHLELQGALHQPLTQLFQQHAVLWSYFVYQATVWMLLGIVLMKYQLQATRLLWIARRRQRLRLLSGSCVKTMSVCSTLLAALLLARAMLSCGYVMIYEDKELPWMAANVQQDSGQFGWRFVLQYFVWEVAALCVVLWMLAVVPMTCEGDPLIAQVTPATTRVSFKLHLPTPQEVIKEYFDYSHGHYDVYEAHEHDEDLSTRSEYAASAPLLSDEEYLDSFKEQDASRATTEDSSKQEDTIPIHFG